MLTDMKKLSYLIFITFCLISITFQSLQAAIANDICANATPITLGKVCNGSTPNVDNSGAEDEGTIAVPSCFNYDPDFAPANDFWFSFVAPQGEKVSIFTNDFSGSLYSLDMVLYAGTCESLSEISGSCNSNEGFIKNISVTSGDTYYLRISGQGQEGNFCLEIIEPPANDICSNSTTLTIGNNCTAASPNGTNFAANDEGNAGDCFETSGGFTPINDVWFDFVAPAGGKVHVNVLPETNDFTTYEIAIYSGTCGSLTQIACKSEDPGVLNTLALTPGNTYYVQVNGKYETIGNFCIKIIEPVANDECTGAIALTIGSSCTGNNTNRSNIAAVDEETVAEPSCFDSSDGFYAINDVWYKFVASTDGKVHVNVESEIDDNNFYTIGLEVAVYSGSCGSFTQIACGSANFVQLNNLVVTSGDTYYIQVNGESGEFGNFCLSVREPLPNDECAGAIPLTTGSFCTGSTTNGDNTGAVDEGIISSGNCLTSNPNDIWFSFVPTSSGWVTISTDFEGGTLTDTDIALFSGTCGSLTEIGCDGDGGITVRNNSILDNQILTLNETYYIRVAGYNGATGSFCLEVTEKDCSHDFEIDSQAKVAALANLNCTTIDGDLSFTGDGVTDLSSLSSITKVMGNLTINNCDMLTTLDGLDNLDTVSGNLTIRSSDLLATCCSVFTIIDEGGVIGSTSIFSNAVGCRSLTEILTNCTPVCEHFEQDSLALIALYNATDGPNWKNKWDLTKSISTWYGVTQDFALCITGLNLSNNQLKGTVPNLDLPFLETLNLYNNEITVCAELTQLPALNTLDVRSNALSFDDLLANRGKATTSFLYGNQAICSESIEVIVDIEADWTVNLGFDDTVSTNKYQWRKDFSNIGDTLATNTFSIAAIQESDVGEYYCTIINPNLPDLILNSCTYKLRGNCTTRSTDSLALIDLYLATNGPNWQTKWDLSKPINTWAGVTATDIGCVTSVYLSNNKLTGILPDLNMSQLASLSLGSNNLQGNIPDLNTPKLTELYLSNNNFTSCSEFTHLDELQYLDLSSNAFTFEDLLINRDKAASSFSYSNQVVCIDTIAVNLEQGEDWTVNLNIDDAISTNKYQWKKGFSKIGDTLLTNSFTLENVNNSDDGLYNATISNPNLPGLILFSCKYQLKVICSTRAADSLSLVQLYNATDGPNWKNKWDLSKPLHTWYGVEAAVEGCVTELNLSRNHLKGTLPDLNLQTIIRIDLSHDTLSGIIPDFTNLPNLEYLYLGNNQLSGNIPDFANLPNLIELSIWGNELAGALPDFSGLPLLRILNLSSNQFTGTFPNFSKLDSLRNLWLYNNQLTGMIPNFIHLKKLTNIAIRYNQLEGAIPDFTHLTELERLGLSGNKLEGAIPDFNNPKLIFLDLSYNNHLSGAIPNFSHIPELNYLYLSGNNLTGTAPNFSNLPNLWYLGFRSIKQLQLPKFTNLPALVQLDVKFGGFSFDDILPNLTIPADTFLIGTQNLFCDPNPITINAELGEMVTLDLMVDDTVTSNIYQWYKNDVLIANAPNTNTLTIANFQESDDGIYQATITNPNASHGSIVNSCEYDVALFCEVAASDSLALVELYNALDGPNWIHGWDLNMPVKTWGGLKFSGCNLIEINLHFNHLHGEIPDINLPDLKMLDLSGNQLFGIIPNFTHLPQLEKLFLSSNLGLNGAIPSFNHLDHLIVFHGAYNSHDDCPDLTGHPTLTTINLSSNLLTFEDIIPNIDLFLVDEVHNFYGYAPQHPFDKDANKKVTLAVGADYTRDLDFDAAVSTNVYKWIRDSTIIATSEVNKFTFTNLKAADSGAYFTIITNPNAPKLTLITAIDTLIIGDGSGNTSGICDEEDLVVSTIEQELYHARNTLTSTGTLTTGHTTVFKAGTSITLKPGFQAVGIFSAIIEDCPAVIIADPIAEARISPNTTTNLVKPNEVEMKIFPNPFYEATTIAYELPSKERVTLQVFDFMGKEIVTLEEGLLKEKGRYEVNFQANQLVSGTYFVVLQSGEYYEVQKLMLLKN